MYFVHYLHYHNAIANRSMSGKIAGAAAAVLNITAKLPRPQTKREAAVLQRFIMQGLSKIPFIPLAVCCCCSCYCATERVGRGEDTLITYSKMIHDGCTCNKASLLPLRETHGAKVE